MEDWIEIIQSLRKNKLRTFLTGLSIAWGIFILVLLVGVSKGLKNGALSMFGNDLSNTLFIRPGTTSIPYKGIKPGKKLKFENRDMNLVTEQIEEVEYYSSRLFLNKNQVSYKNNKGSYEIRCVHPQHWIIENSKVIEGRFVNQYDFDQKRKVVIIGISVKEALFKETTEVIGKYIVINDIPFKVVGVFTDEGEEDEQRMIYLPLTTAQSVFSMGEKISLMVVTVKDPTLERGRAMVDDIIKLLSPYHGFHPEDKRSLFVNNRMERTQNIVEMLNGIQVFTIVIGVLTILAGAIGVMNIMVISVKERTKEIGLRKAIGAKPTKIIFSIIKEAIFVTLLFGYLGLLFGVLLLELINKYTGAIPIFSDARVDLPIALLATGILGIVGVVAGLFPAIKAAKIKPVEALRDA